MPWRRKLVTHPKRVDESMRTSIVSPVSFLRYAHYGAQRSVELVELRSIGGSLHGDYSIVVIAELTRVILGGRLSTIGQGCPRKRRYPDFTRARSKDSEIGDKDGQKQ